MIKEMVLSVLAVIILCFVGYKSFSVSYSKGDCVIMSSDESASTGRGEYIKYDDWTHWVIKDGKVFGLKADRNSITTCD